MSKTLFIGGPRDGQWCDDFVEGDRIRVVGRFPLPKVTSSPEQIPINEPLEIYTHTYQKEIIATNYGKREVFVSDNIKGNWLDLVLESYRGMS